MSDLLEKIKDVEKMMGKKTLSESQGKTLIEFLFKEKKVPIFQEENKEEENVLGDDDGENDNGHEEQKQEEDDDNNFECDDDDSFGSDDEDDDDDNEGENKEETCVVSVHTNNYLSGRFICKFCGNDYASGGSLHNHLYYKPSRPYAKLCGSIRK